MEDLGTPPAIHAIPVLQTREKLLRYVARAHPQHWIQAEDLRPQEMTHAWGYYHEPVPHPDTPGIACGITIEIALTQRWELLVTAEAQEPCGYRRQMGFCRSYRPPAEGGYEALFYHLKTLALQWLLEARLFVTRAQQIEDPTERLVFECICTREEFALAPLPFTASSVANWCGWYLAPPNARSWRGAPDAARAVPYLHRLCQKQLLVMGGNGEYHTPEYAVDQVKHRVFAPVIPEASWLQSFSIPEVIGSERQAGSSGKAWLKTLLEQGLAPAPKGSTLPGN